MKLQGLAILGSAALAMLGATAAFSQSTPAAAPNGEALFRQRCASCHTIAAGGRATIGPNLAGVVGRRAAASNFTNYSPALRGAGLSWTRANLDEYLANPTAKVRGTRMVVRVTDAAQRRALIDYMARPAR